MSEGSQHEMIHDDFSKNPTMPNVSPRQPENCTYPLFLNVESKGMSPLRESCGENLPSEFVDLKPPAQNKMQQHNPELYQRRVLSDKAYNCSPLSPRLPLSQSESNEECFKSPLPTVNSFGSSDSTHSPPTATPRSMAVCSKRVGNDVRREHSKRRRPSPRINKHGSAVNLWSDTCSQASTDTEDDDFELLFTSSPNPDKTKQYWEWCYGKDAASAVSHRQSWSAKRLAPAKGCISYKNEPSCTPTEQYKTPPTSPQRKPRRSKTDKKVQFGLPRAVEYEIDEPAHCLKVLPPDVAKARYPMGEKEETPVEEEMTKETKKNSALLAEWEEDFDEPKPRSRRQRLNRRSSSRFKPTPIKTSGEDIRQDVSELFTPSPSTQVTETLASLSMTSPKVASHDDTQSCGGKLPFSVTNTENPIVPEDIDITSDSAIHNTAGNSTSMDITPPQRALTQDTSNHHTDTTPPPSSLGLETIHSVGGALDIDSPASGKQMACHSPLPTMMNLCSSGEKSFDDSGEKEVVRHEYIDITRMLLRNPADDQEWSAADLFQSMALQDNHRLESILLSFNQKQKHVVSMTDKLCSKVNEIAETMPKPNINTEGEALKLIGNEWLKLETAFISQLNTDLESMLGEMASLSSKATVLQQVHSPKVTKRVKDLSLIESYNHEIQELERLVKREREHLDSLEACLAPHAAIGCQGTLAIMGFRFDEFNGEMLQLSFEHVVGGTESTVMFDLSEGSLTVQRTLGLQTKQQSIPSDHVAAKLHHHMLKNFADGDLTRFDASNLAELQDVIASVSKQLGEIDSMVAGLHVVAKDSSILVNAEMPSLEIELPNGDCIVLNFGRTTSLVPQHFTLFPGDGGTATRNRMPDDVTSHNVFQKLLEHCKT